MEEGRVRVPSTRMGFRGQEGLCAAEPVRGEAVVWPLSGGTAGVPVRKRSFSLDPGSLRENGARGLLLRVSVSSDSRSAICLGVSMRRSDCGPLWRGGRGLPLGSLLGGETSQETMRDKGSGFTRASFER